MSATRPAPAAAAAPATSASTGGGAVLAGLFSGARGEQPDADVAARARKSAASLSSAIVHLANDTSLGLYRIQEHVHKKVPQLVDDRQALLQMRPNLDIAASDAAEIQELLRGMDRIDSFARCLEYINQIAALQQSQRQQQQQHVPGRAPASAWLGSHPGASR
ncbi:hypothetical protein HK105_209093 [Polyrhizophydium stewartii]|uniref:BLOC-1-related complex subunit 7 n=1 Tax=Polyrhizophydium stewartii TaxID=2732419 RepID=A0ABR4MVZ4_9FUNG|nr:hypothetical protein HK105_001312 [Polyrhizophydium stewartii]